MRQEQGRASVSISVPLGCPRVEGMPGLGTDSSCTCAGLQCCLEPALGRLLHVKAALADCFDMYLGFQHPPQ